MERPPKIFSDTRELTYQKIACAFYMRGSVSINLILFLWIQTQA
jgi:hypothetical protein